MTETLAPFPHPETGEPLETLPEFQAALAEIEKRMAPLFFARRRVSEAMHERFEPVLPENPRNRTVAQAMVARCPRCRKEIEAE